MDQSEHPGVPQRPPASAHLLLNSLDRYESIDQEIVGDNPAANDFIINRNNALLYGYFTRVAITQVFFEYRVPTIIFGKNDAIIFHNITTDVSGVIDMEPGYYTPDSLAAMLQAALVAAGAEGAGAGYTAVYDDVAGRIVVDSNSADEFEFLLPVSWPGALTSTQSAIVLATYRTLGLVPSIASVSGVYNGGRTPNLLYTPYVDIISDRLTKFQRVKDTDTNVPPQSNIIARVYFQAPNTQRDILGADSLGSAPFNICIDYNTPKHIKWSPDEAINQLDFRVYDQYGDLLYWDKSDANWNYALTMLASET